MCRNKTEFYLPQFSLLEMWSQIGNLTWYYLSDWMDFSVMICDIIKGPCMSALETNLSIVNSGVFVFLTEHKNAALI